MTSLSFGWATPEQLDALGASDPDKCKLCAQGAHQCGACGREILHVQGTTCPECWQAFWAEEEDSVSS